MATCNCLSILQLTLTNNIVKNLAVYNAF